MEDRDIVRLYLMRDEQALAVTREKYGSRLRRLTYDLTEDFGAAEECENDTYLKAWQSIPPHEPGDYLFPYLARIARHEALNFCRNSQRLKRKADIRELSAELEQTLPGRTDAAQAAEARELGEILNRFLRDLTPEKRKIFLRRYWYLDSIAAIAEGYGLSRSKVKVTLYRCREQLRKRLESEGYRL